MSLWGAWSSVKGTYQAWRESKRGTQSLRGEGILDSDRPSIVERQRRLTPFNDFGSQYLLPTDPPHISWSDGSLEPVEEKIVEGEWELHVDSVRTDSSGWAYAFNWEFVFHAVMTSQDLVRKRIWLRRRHEEHHALPHIGAGTRGLLRVMLTPEEEGALLEEAVPAAAASSGGAAAAAHIDEVECMHALFGKSAEVQGKLVWARPETAHEELSNMAELCGNIALVRRDPPENERARTGFVDKAFRAVAAGARGVVVINTHDDLLSPWTWTHDLMDADQIKVPVVCVRARDEESLRQGAWCHLSFTLQGSQGLQAEARQVQL